MLGLFLIYFIGKSYFDLAVKHDKNKWLYALLGVIAYYAGEFIFAILYVVYLGFTDPIAIETINESLLGIISVPFGLLSCWGLYKFLEKKWNKPQSASESDILDDDII